MAEGLDVEFRVGDAEDLPVDDASFDAVLNVFGAMFAPDHQRAADEIARVTRPSGSNRSGARPGRSCWPVGPTRQWQHRAPGHLSRNHPHRSLIGANATPLATGAAAARGGVSVKVGTFSVIPSPARSPDI
jgi:SAM-dependent methyltransferase